MAELFFLAAIAVSIIGLIIATYTDLKSRIVPNKLNYGLAIIGLGIFSIQSIAQASYWPIIYSIIGLAFGFLFGWVLWKLGIFAGGDVKLFMGLGALNPLTPALAKSGIFAGINTPVFPITLFIYALISFLPYGLFVLIYRLIKNKKFQKELWTEMKPKILLAIHAMCFAPACYVIINYFNLGGIATTIITIILLFVWGLFKENKKFITIIALIAAALINWVFLAQGIIGAMLISVLLYTLLKIMLATRKLLSTEVPVSKLEEGMIPAKSLALKGKKVVEAEGINYKKIIKHAKEGNIKAIKEMLLPQKEIISARKARGLTPEEIKTVKKLAAKGLIPKKMLIKESMPFVPTMLLGYLLCLAVGDLALKMLIMGVL